MKTTRCITLLAGILGMSSTAHAATIQWDNGGTGNEWSTADNWTGNVLPTDADIAEIGNGNTAFATALAFHNSGTNTVDGLSVGVNGNADGELNVSGGTLTVENTGGLQVGSNNNASGTLNINGGILEIQQANNFIGNASTGTGIINLSSGTLRNASGSFTNFFMGNGGGDAELNISGGSLENIRMTLNNGGTSTVSVSGDTATTDFENWTFGGTTFINMVANSTGISLLDVNFWSGDGTENLTVDLSAYTDGFDYGDPLASLDLIENQFATFDASRWDSVSLVGAYGDFVYTDTTFGTILSIENISAIPEPSSTALLGLGGLALMLRRRR